MRECKELSLVKGEERFVFRYEPGTEEEVLDAFVGLANDRKHNFDWFDAAVLSFQLSKHLVDEADRMLCPESDGENHNAGGYSTPWSFL